MKKIGGVNMNTTYNFTGNITKQKCYNIYEALKESLKEVKLIKQGKIEAKTWDELYEELKQNKE